MKDKNRPIFALPVGHHFLLFLLFLGLKLGGVIEWHWVWVCMPMILKVSYLGAVFVGGLFKEGSKHDD